MSTAGGPERDPDGDARAWDDIVRRLQDDADPPGTERSDDAGPERSTPFATGPRDYELADDAPFADDPDPEDDWEPGDPGDVIAGMRPGTLVAWGVLLGVSAVLLILGFVMDGLPWWLWIPGLALILGSLVSLFQALPEQRSEYDDGAQV